MALQSTCRNLFGAQQHVDINVVTIVIVSGATPRDADRSSPETTAVNATGGVYTCTMPSGQFQILVGAETVNAPNTAPGDKVTVHGLSSASGVTTFSVTKSDTTALTAGEEIHLVFLVLGS